MTRILLVSLLFIQVPAGLRTQAGVVTGILRTKTGFPVEGVRVAAIPADPPIRGSVLESLGLTDSAGRYRLENVPPGRYHILVGQLSQPRYHPGVTELGKATTIQVVAGSTIEVPEMAFQGNRVSGRVMDLATGRGRRIQNLILCCDYSQPVPAKTEENAERLVSAATFAANISGDGSFVFPSVPPGNYFLSTADPGVIPVSRALAIGEDDVTGLQLGVAEGVEVQGTVLDQNGAPVTASIQLRPRPTNSVFDTARSPTKTSVLGSLVDPKGIPSLDGIRDRLLRSAKVQSDKLEPDGSFAFRNVYPGAYLLDVRTTGATLLEREIQVESRGLTKVLFQVAAIQVTGRVVAANGGPLPKLNYIRLVGSGTDANVSYGFPDAEGHFSLLLVPGQYRVFTEGLGHSVQSVSDSSRDITRTEFTVQGGRIPQIVVTLEP